MDEETHLVGMGSILMLGPVTGVAEGLAAAGILAGVGLFARVRSQMGLEVFQSGVRFEAALEL